MEEQSFTGSFKIRTRYVATYSQTGSREFPEDTWNTSMEIWSEDSLFDWMKRLHKSSAMSFNGYPFGGLFHPNYITFEKQEILINQGKSYFGLKEACDRPEYFELATKRYEEWYAAIRERLPRLREAQAKRLKEEKERAIYDRLKEEFD
jgi:hypothetical protein